ncbi:MAG TPA: site-2 protease family protein [Terriglobales bacterium]|nr:site-2 protease family protein [Terriglobales bacterium]
MASANQGSFHLFRFSGVDVFLHWSWFLVAILEIKSRAAGRYSSFAWNVIEYLFLFLIVLLHEFGHALACRQVGGVANRIVLWPLGGVAFVNPPPRPGATLWSIAAGPLVNVVLVAVFGGIVKLYGWFGLVHTWPDLYRLLQAIWFMNLGLLVFNMLPVYPLDGGQILRSVLWFALGRGRSLMVATIIGFLGVGGFIILALWMHSVLFGAIAAFMLLNCWGGLRHAQALLRLAKLPRREGFACPSCKAAPPVGENWKCGRCRRTFDSFQTLANCPHCAAQFPVTQCLECGAAYPMGQWIVPAFCPANP